MYCCLTRCLGIKESRKNAENTSQKAGLEMVVVKRSVRFASPRHRRARFNSRPGDHVSTLGHDTQAQTLPRRSLPALMTSLHRRPSRTSGLPLLWLATILLLLCQPAHAIKFALQAARFPAPKCIWNAAHPGALVIVTANIAPGDHQRIDIEILDSGPQRNVYLSKKNISGEKRFAVTAHSDEDVGVCFRNYLEPGPQGMSCALILYCSASVLTRERNMCRWPCGGEATLAGDRPGH